MSKQKPVLALQHTEGDPPGILGDILEQHGIVYDVVQVDEHHPLPWHQYAFEWPWDSFALPPAAVRLATNGNMLNQAFRLDRRA